MALLFKVALCAVLVAATIAAPVTQEEAKTAAPVGAASSGIAPAAPTKDKDGKEKIEGRIYGYGPGFGSGYGPEVGGLGGLGYGGGYGSGFGGYGGYGGGYSG
ncbi:hypothetical protein BIW11_09809, partial [Tropilaelaps mercedesae]